MIKYNFTQLKYKMYIKRKLFTCLREENGGLDQINNNLLRKQNKQN